MSRFRTALAVVAVAACGGKYAGTTTSPSSRAAPVGLEAAALPYQVLARNGTQVDEAAFWTGISRARAVCIGEEHPNPHHHWVQLHVVREIAKRRGNAKLAVGFEMIQRPFQGPLDDYAAKRIDADALRSRTGWAERWGYDFGFYGPTMDAAIAGGGALLALNAPKELVKKIVRHGLESLTADEKAQVPELKLDDAAHRAWFDALMEGMGGSGAHAKTESGGAKQSGDAPPTTTPHGSPHDDAEDTPAMPSAERIYTAQVLWDETMADGGATWLKANATGHLVILAGNGHCHDSAIIGRLKRRGITDAVSIRAVIDDGAGGLAEILAKPINDYLVVLKLPNQPAHRTATNPLRPHGSRVSRATSRSEGEVGSARTWHSASDVLGVGTVRAASH